MGCMAEAGGGLEELTHDFFGVSYEIHFAGNANYSPSGLMEKLIASARSGSVVNVGAVIDATGEDYFLHDLKYVTAIGVAAGWRFSCLPVYLCATDAVSGRTGMWSTSSCALLLPKVRTRGHDINAIARQ
jgi:hypothetical protein